MNKTLCVWKHTTLGDATIETFIKFLNKTFDAEFEYAGQVQVNANRVDQFFWIQDKYVPQFAIKRLATDIMWWEDVFFNNQQGEYPEEVLRKFPDPVDRYLYPALYEEEENEVLHDNYRNT